MQSGPDGLERKESAELSRTIARKNRPHPAEPDRNSRSHLAGKLLSERPEERIVAVGRLKDDPAVLAELACSSPFPDVRQAAVASLADEAALAEIAAYSHFKDSRQGAVRRVEGSGDCLEWIACTSIFSDTTAAAITLMKDGERAEVAIRSQKAAARKAALAMITDGPSLLRVAEESRFKGTREEAVRRLSDDLEALCGLAIGSGRSDARKAAVAHLCPRLQEVGADVLVEIASLARIEDYRLLALAQIATDPPSLRRVLQKSRHWGTRMTAIMLISEIVGEIDDLNMLSDIAILSPDREGRMAAVAKLSADPQALMEVARRSQFRDTRDSALRRLAGDGERLRKISRSACYPDTRRKAHRLSCGKEVLRKTLEGILG